MTTISFQIDNAQDRDLVLAFLRKVGVHNLWNSDDEPINLEKVLTAEELESLDKSIRQAKSGEGLIPHEDVMAMIEEKYGL